MLRVGLSKAAGSARTPTSAPLQWYRGLQTASVLAQNDGPLFDKILVANRGEIACRIFKTAKRMGIKTVAIYSDADRDSQHVKMADEAVYIGASESSESYLVGEKVIAAAKQVGAQAIHPGYGFLSTNPDFCQLCEDEGVNFIGPGPDAMRTLGLKMSSMKVAQDAGVSTAPRHEGNVVDVAHALELAPSIGFPIIMKASAGGGGKGMRVCWDMDELEEGYTLAKNEAISTVGDGTMMMQHFVCPNKGRHVEIQVICDKHGNYVYLNERECSVQRRHQKVIEEAPSPLVTPAMRKEMGEQAVALCKAVGYVSAGTVEFLVDPDIMKWYFLEMNTRLQVEHPITEHITGVDIVEEMIRVAADKPLSITQEDVGIDGWAFEARVYAEDPVSAEMFRPDSGPLAYLKTPETGTDGDFTVRVDTGVEEGDSVTVFYDPMICKLIVHGPDRASALAKLRSSLREYNIAGLRTNIDFVHSVAAHPEFMSGDYTTTFIEDNKESLFAVNQAPAHQVAQATLSIILNEQNAAAAVQHATEDATSPWAAGSGLRLNTVQSRKFAFVGARDQEYEVDVTYLGDSNFVMIVGDESLAVSGTLDGDSLRTIINGVSSTVRTARLADSVHTFGVDGELHLDVTPPAFLAAADDAATGNVVMATMDGQLMQIMVKPGDVVEEGQPVAMLFAMKMESVLRSPRAGVVASVSAEEGAQVAINQLLLTLEEEEGEGDDAGAENAN